MYSTTPKKYAFVSVQNLTITDKVLAIAFPVSNQESNVSGSHDGYMDVTGVDDDNNNDSLTLDLSGQAQQIEIAADDVTIGQQNQSPTSLSLVSPMHTSPHASKRDHSSVADVAISPRCSDLSEVHSPRRDWCSESVAVFVNVPTDTDREIDTSESNAKNLTDPSFSNGSSDLQKQLNDDVSQGSQNTVEISGNVVPDELDEKKDCSQTPAFFQSLLETPKKHRDGRSFWLKRIEETRKNIRLKNRLTFLDDDVYDDLKELDKDMCDDPKVTDAEDIDADAPISTAVKEELNKNDGSEMLQRNEDVSEIREDDSLTASDSSFSYIPRFYYPGGILPTAKKASNNELNDVQEVFRKYNDQINFSQMDEVCCACKLCSLWKRPLYNCLTCPPQSVINFDKFESWWKKFEENAYDEASRFVYILTNGARNSLVPSDFDAIVQDLIETLPSLDCLKEDKDFHRIYIITVTTRIFWTVCRTWNNKISVVELRQSSLLKAIERLETVEVNEEHEYFSYEHFYVIYCKFVALADSRNYLIPADLKRYSDGALTGLVVQRLFSGAVFGLKNEAQEYVMDYRAFISFILAEVDKCHLKSIEYWFRIMDLDGDGRISLDEMARFYSEILEKVRPSQGDVLSFKDVAILLSDMISPRKEVYFTLSDLKRAPRFASYFFNTFVNSVKHALQEANSPLNPGKRVKAKYNDWVQFCTVEYAILVAEVMENAAKEEVILNANKSPDSRDSDNDVKSVSE